MCFIIRLVLFAATLGTIELSAPGLALAAAGDLIGRPSPLQTVDFSVHLPLRDEAQLDNVIALQSDPNSPLYHHFLTVQQFRAAYGPAAQTVARARALLAARGFAVTQQTSQTLRVRGTAANVDKVFNTRLGVVRGVSGRVRLASATALNVPRELAALGATLTGFERRVRLHVDSRRVPRNRYGPFGGYTFDDLKQAYTYPSDRALDGAGATVGILMDGDVSDADTQAELGAENYTPISGKTPPALIRRPIFGGLPFGFGDFVESSIDVQTSQGSAPAAQIVLYNIPDLSDESVFAGLITVVEDNAVDVLNSSFSGCELLYTAAYNHGTDFTGILKAESALYKQGSAQGISFVAASGDSAGLACPGVSYLAHDPNARFLPSVESPADDPNVVGVGGTNLETTVATGSVPPLRANYVAENANGDAEEPYDPLGLGSNVAHGYWGSGSGTSTLFAKPWYQQKVSIVGNKRSVPDVSMQMGGCPGDLAVNPCHDGDSYSLYFIAGAQDTFIGTSLSAPEFAGLLALKIEASKTRLGNANGYIYERAQANDRFPPGSAVSFFHQGIPGYNGVVNVAAATRGYNPIIGVGTPYARNFIGEPQLPLAGDPQTLSNP